MSLKIAVGADHRGVQMLPVVMMELQHHGCQVLELGADTARTSDYPDLAYVVATAVATAKADCGVLIGGSGIGMAIAANKVAAVRAALVHDEIGAEVSRCHNDANVLCLPADLLGPRIVERIIKVWLESVFEGGRHARRVNKITVIERGGDPNRAADQTRFRSDGAILPEVRGQDV